MALFEKFGEFNSAEEINELARNLRHEGDKESLYSLTRENGIDEFYADLFVDTGNAYLIDELGAAQAKIQIETKEMNPPEIMQDWIEFIKSSCLENNELALAVRSKGKSLKGAIAELLKWGFANQYDIPKGVLQSAGVSAKVTLGIPSMARAKKILIRYYLGK